LGDNFGHASPVIFPGDFDVPDLHGDVSFASDAQSFVDGFEDRVAFVAHVSGINAAEFSQLRVAESDQFLCLRKRRWSVLQRGGNADRARLSWLHARGLSSAQVRGRRLHIVVAEHHAADLRGADVAARLMPMPCFSIRAKITGGKLRQSG